MLFSTEIKFKIEHLKKVPYPPMRVICFSETLSGGYVMRSCLFTRRDHHCLVHLIRDKHFLV